MPPRIEHPLSPEPEQETLQALPAITGEDEVQANPVTVLGDRLDTLFTDPSVI